MGFELPNGKTARNLQDQVKFLTEKVKELIARVNELELHIEIVDELPETGSSDVIYFVPVEDPEEGNYYNEYMWIDDTWELIGTTQIDLSGYVDLASAQTITGEKTIQNTSLDFSHTSSPDTVFSIYAADYGALDIRRNTTTQIEVGNNNIFFRNILPLSSSNNLGLQSAKWNNLYLSGRVDFGNDSYITKDQYNRITLNVSDNAKIVVDAGQTYVNNNLLPLTATRDLGSDDYKWRNLYLSGNLTDGTNTVSVAAISKTRLYLHRFQFTYTGGGGYLNVITNSATGISDTESNFQTAINSAVSVYVNQSDGSRALFLSASLSQNDCRWFTSSGTATGGSVSFGSESIAEI